MSKNRAFCARSTGKVAIANAKLTYQRYREIVSSRRWQALAERGAQTQRLLWASTGTKNPELSRRRSTSRSWSAPTPSIRYRPRHSTRSAITDIAREPRRGRGGRVRHHGDAGRSRNLDEGGDRQAARRRSAAVRRCVREAAQGGRDAEPARAGGKAQSPDLSAARGADRCGEGVAGGMARGG